MNLSFSDVKHYTSSLKLLYVEDEDGIREQFVSIFSKLFEEVITAKNGENGLECFLHHKPDLIISDIRMPIMDGLEMSRHIKQASPDTPIILTTAHSDGEFLMQAIEAGIDKYILKPVDKEKLISALLTVSKQISDRKSAEKLKLIEMQEKINKQAAGVVSKIIDTISNPIVLFDEDQIVYANKAFCTIAGEEFLANLHNGNAKLETLFDVCEVEIEDEENCTCRAELVGKKGRKIFQVCKASIISDEDRKQKIYVFNDITRLEYQKMKIKQYSEHLEEFFYNKLKRERTKAIEALSHVEVVEQIGTQTKDKQHAMDIVAIDGNIAKTFGEQELKVLRRSRLEKMSAHDFISEVGDDLNEAIEDLQESDHELEDQISLLIYPLTQNDLNGVALKLSKYASIINQMIDFGDLAIAVKTLSEFLMELPISDVDEKKYKQLTMFLTNIKDDLRNWRLTNFVEQSSESIHYLDASLMSSCLQLQMVFMPKQEIEDDDDLGLDLF